MVDLGIADRVEVIGYIHAVCSCGVAYLIDLRGSNTVVVPEEGFVRKSPVAEIDPIMVTHGKHFVFISMVDKGFRVDAVDFFALAENFGAGFRKLILHVDDVVVVIILDQFGIILPNHAEGEIASSMVTLPSPFVSAAFF